jgi:hypothetical protein
MYHTSIGQEVTFSWIPNTEEYIAGYKIYKGSSPHNYTNNEEVGKPEIDNGRIQVTIELSIGDYYFTATAYDNNNQESDFSDEIKYLWLPEPTNVRIN